MKIRFLQQKKPFLRGCRKIIRKIGFKKKLLHLKMRYKTDWSLKLQVGTLKNPNFCLFIYGSIEKSSFSP